MTFNKIDGATALKKSGIPLPENWGKLSTSRAEAFVTKALSLVTKEEPPKKVGIIGHIAAGIAGGLAALGATLAPPPAPPKLDAAARKNAKAKVFSDPNYVRSTAKMRKVMARFSRPIRAADPVPMTRQVARRKALNAGLKAYEFRRFMGA